MVLFSLVGRFPLLICPLRPLAGSGKIVRLPLHPAPCTRHPPHFVTQPRICHGWARTSVPRTPGFPSLGSVPIEASRSSPPVLAPCTLFPLPLFTTCLSLKPPPVPFSPDQDSLQPFSVSFFWFLEKVSLAWSKHCPLFCLLLKHGRASSNTCSFPCLLATSLFRLVQPKDIIRLRNPCSVFLFLPECVRIS